MIDGRSCLISRIPQVLNHLKCLLVELSAMDPILPHHYNQHWSTRWEKKRNKREKWTELKSTPLPPPSLWRVVGKNKWWHRILPPLFIAIKKLPRHLTACREFSFFIPQIWSISELATLKSWISQVFCHRVCLLIQYASMDTFFAHNKYQDWKRKDRKKGKV